MVLGRHMVLGFDFVLGFRCSFHKSWRPQAFFFFLRRAEPPRACAVANGGKHHLGRTFKRGRIGVDSDDGPGVFELRSHRQARWKEVFDQDGRFDAKQVICEERDTKWIRRITSSLR